MHRAAGPIFIGVALLAAPLHAVELRLIGMRALPATANFHDAPVGGLSGLDYDAAKDEWVAISDDRSAHGPVRACTVKLEYDETGFTAAAITGEIVLRRADGSAYPDRGPERPDFEAVRLDPRDGTLWYTSEGEPALRASPFVRHATRDGKFLGTLPLPAQFEFAKNSLTGPRDNLTLESLTFTPDGDSLWLGLEAPLVEDGPVSRADAGGVTRLTRLARDGTVRGQFAYPLDAWQLAPAKGMLADNGLSELLALPDGRLLALERSGAQDANATWHFAARIYEVDLARATDVARTASLVGAQFTPAAKRLVFEFGRAGRTVDNLEGLAWGRMLRNGRPSLVVVSDDNFSPEQQTQFWVFEVTPSWDDVFAGVVHDARHVNGFVGEYRWLSNFFPCRVEWEGRVYGSAEAAYQSAKYPPAERDVFTTLDPDAAKKLSRAKAYDAAAWEKRKEQAMREVVAAKFSQHPELAAKLRATGDRTLEETNWWGDTFWGVHAGQGENVLGKILMETRARLAAAAAR